MDGWRISPGAARGVLEQAAVEARSGMREAMQTAARSIEEAHAVSGPETQAALLSLGSDLFEAQIAATRARLITNIDSAAQAIDAYERGDEHMAVTWAGRPQ